MSFTTAITHDCFGQKKYVYRCGAVMGENFFSFLKRFGEVELFGDQPTRFVRMNVPECFRLTAVEGDDKVTVTYKQSAKEFSKEFERALATFLGQDALIPPVLLG